MTLAQYLLAHSISQADFAARLGTSDATVSRWASGKMIPRREMIARIAAETAGAVNPASWFNLPASSTPNNPPDMGDAA